MFNAFNDQPIHFLGNPVMLDLGRRVSGIAGLTRGGRAGPATPSRLHQNSSLQQQSAQCFLIGCRLPTPSRPGMAPAQRAYNCPGSCACPRLDRVWQQPHMPLGEGDACLHRVRVQWKSRPRLRTGGQQALAQGARQARPAEHALF